MKKTFTLCCLLLLVNGLYAQKTLFSQDFNEFPGYNIIGWTHSFTGGVPWMVGEPYLVGPCIGPYMADKTITNKVAAIPDCGWSYNNSNVLMYTPAISLASDTGVWLSYDSYFNKVVSGSFTERATVEVSTDTGKTWTVVQDVPANPSMLRFTKYYINLSAFNHAPAIWIGFRYSDDGGDMAGWAVDNVNVFVPSQKDIALTTVTPVDSMLSYLVINNAFTHKGQIVNMGNDTIRSFIINYRHQSGGPIYSYSVTGVSIPRFGTYNFTHNIPDTITTAGVTNVNVWASLIGDTTHSNDSIMVSLRGTYFMPKKIPLIENGTSTQDAYGPQSWVVMNNIPDSIYACKITVHSGDTDAMYYSNYDNFLYTLRWPNMEYTYVDRRLVDEKILYNVLDSQKNYFGFADLLLKPNIVGDSLTVNISVLPAIDMTGDFRLALCITEDHVTGTDSQYAQRNKYAGGFFGPMGGFESKPNPVPAADMYYNFVARKITPDPAGIKGMLPATLTHGNTYGYTLGAKLSPSWQSNKLKAIVMLIRSDDSSILNSNQTTWYLGVQSQQPATITANIYPNPANDYANVLFELPKTEKLNITVTDIMGRALYLHEATYTAGANKITIPVNSLANGMYLVSLIAEDSRKTLKLEVLR